MTFYTRGLALDSRHPRFIGLRIADSRQHVVVSIVLPLARGGLPRARSSVADASRFAGAAAAERRYVGRAEVVVIAEPSDPRELLAVIRGWFRLLADGQWDHAAAMLDEPNSHGIRWTPEYIRYALDLAYGPRLPFPSRTPGRASTQRA
jgi:hypothetical protein